MSVALQRDIGKYIAVKKGIDPANASAGAINGAAIDRAGQGGGKLALSAVLHHACGAATGAPTARTVDSKIQDSADGSTGWADYVDPKTGVVAAAAQLTADNQDAEVDVDLSAAKKFIRVVETVGFTGGTTPAIPVAAGVSLGGYDQLPA